MRVSVEFQDEQLELELPDEMLVGLWKGPAGVAGGKVSRISVVTVEEAALRISRAWPLRLRGRTRWAV